MEKDKIYISKVKDFDIFSKEVRHWLFKLNLINFEVFLRHDKIEAQSRAECTFNIEDKIVVISLGTEWANIEPTHKEICKTAFHECCELLLGQAYIGLLNLNIDDEEVNGRMHSVIRTLENTWFKEDYALRYEKKCHGKCKPKKGKKK